MYNHRLDTFICSADAGSFNKAAEEMYITPSAVIKQINLLEASLGVKLFIRNHRGLILTESGKSLYRDAKYIIRFCGEAASIVYGEYLKFQNGQFEDWWVDDEIANHLMLV